MASPSLTEHVRPSVQATAPLVSVIIVNYRRWPETAALVRQLLGKESFHRDRIEIIVVDNASPPHALDEDVRKRTRVTICRLDQNRGFAAGVNTGVRHSRGRWLLVLNPDLHVSPDFLDLVLTAGVELEADPPNGRPVGIAGFHLRNADGTRQFSAGFFPNMSRMLLGLLRPRRYRKYHPLRTRRRRPVPWVTGCCLLIRRECLRQLGGFDEDFFLYYEDVDLCLRARKRGWTVCYEPAVRAVHTDPLQNRQPTAMQRAITRHASLTYFQKHLFGWQFWTLAQLVRAEAFLRQQRAKWKERRGDAETYHQLRGICRDLMRGRTTEARSRLDALLRSMERG